MVIFILMGSSHSCCCWGKNCVSLAGFYSQNKGKIGLSGVRYQVMSRSQPLCVQILIPLGWETTLGYLLLPLSFNFITFLHFKIPLLGGFIPTWIGPITKNKTLTEVAKIIWISQNSILKGLKNFRVEHEYVVPGKDSDGVYRSGHAQVPSLSCKLVQKLELRVSNNYKFQNK